MEWLLTENWNQEKNDFRYAQLRFPEIQIFSLIPNLVLSHTYILLILSLKYFSMLPTIFVFIEAFI